MVKIGQVLVIINLLFVTVPVNEPYFNTPVLVNVPLLIKAFSI